MAGIPGLLNRLAAAWAQIDEPGSRLSIKQNIVPDVDPTCMQLTRRRKCRRHDWGRRAPRLISTAPAQRSCNRSEALRDPADATADFVSG